MKTPKPKTAYMCGIAWDYEVGHTDVPIFARPQDVGHEGCDVIQVRITAVRRALKAGPEAKIIPVGRIRHEQMKSLRKEMAALNAFYERVRDEPSKPWNRRQRAARKKRGKR